ncbi:MAG: hypothetical protein LUD81_03760 [Clostridiales bacterium]|nr:hypothetical protein [Clostridiales bacterium]
MTIEISAVDLRYLSEDYNSINLLDQVRVISTPHGMNKVFPVTELSIQFDDPENSTYVLGDKVEGSFTSSTRKENQDILNRIENLPDEDSVLEKAKANATEIMNLVTQGYVTVITNSSGSEALYVSSESATVAYDYDNDIWNSDVKLWKWNVNGLGYSEDGGKSYTTAITMDGAIVADFITTGHMSADRIEAGILRSSSGDSKWNLDTGEITMTRGSINIGDVFSVSKGGVLTCTSGEIGGFTITATTIENSLLKLSGSGLAFLSSGLVEGTYAPSYWAVQPSAKGITMQLENRTDFLLWTHLDSSSDSTYTAKLYMSDVTVCPECGGSFQWDSSAAALVCQSCGYVYTSLKVILEAFISCGFVLYSTKA